MVGGCWNAVKFGWSYECDRFSGERFPVRPCLLRIIYVRMTLEEFRKSLNNKRPPEDLTLSLAALWWDAKGDWTKAHESAQQDEGPAGAWVHAYLHRKEGDQGNAAYWYGRAGKPVCREPLDAEWLSIVRDLVGARPPFL